MFLECRLRETQTDKHRTTEPTHTYVDGHHVASRLAGIIVRDWQRTGGKGHPALERPCSKVKNHFVTNVKSPDTATRKTVVYYRIHCVARRTRQSFRTVTHATADKRTNARTTTKNIPKEVLASTRDRRGSDGILCIPCPRTVAQKLYLTSQPRICSAKESFSPRPRCILSLAHGVSRST